MTITGALIIVPGVCYATAALIYAWHHQWPLSIVYAGYAIGNAGLWWLDKLVAGAA